MAAGHELQGEAQQRPTPLHEPLDLDGLAATPPGGGPRKIRFQESLGGRSDSDPVDGDVRSAVEYTETHEMGEGGMVSLLMLEPSDAEGGGGMRRASDEAAAPPHERADAAWNKMRAGVDRMTDRCAPARLQYQLEFNHWQHVHSDSTGCAMRAHVAPGCSPGDR